MDGVGAPRRRCKLFCQCTVAGCDQEDDWDEDCEEDEVGHGSEGQGGGFCSLVTGSSGCAGHDLPRGFVEDGPEEVEVGELLGIPCAFPGRDCRNLEEYGGGGEWSNVVHLFKFLVDETMQILFRRETRAIKI